MADGCTLGTGERGGLLGGRGGVVGDKGMYGRGGLRAMVRGGAWATWATPCAPPTAGERPASPAVTDGNCSGGWGLGSTWEPPFSSDEAALIRDPRPAVHVMRWAMRRWIRLILKRRNTATMNARRRIMTMAAMTPGDGPEDLLRAECAAAVMLGCVTLPRPELS